MIAGAASVALGIGFKDYVSSLIAGGVSRLSSALIAPATGWRSATMTGKSKGSDFAHSRFSPRNQYYGCNDATVNSTPIPHLNSHSQRMTCCGAVFAARQACPPTANQEINRLTARVAPNGKNVSGIGSIKTLR